MRREDVKELHYIAPILNVPSILKNGILSHTQAKTVPHDSVAMAAIQERREVKAVPSGRPLHDYVNLYLTARNPMMYRLQNAHASLCVLKVDPSVMDLPDVVVADRNAASAYVRFSAAAEGLARLDGDLVFADSWTHPDDQVAEWSHKSIKCAEVLAPDRIGPEFLRGAYVSCPEAKSQLSTLCPGFVVTHNPHIFFR